MEEIKDKGQEPACLRVGIESILELRHLVLRPGMPSESANFDGDDKAGTYHFAAFLLRIGLDPYCCVSYYRGTHDGKPAHQLRGMATKPGSRGKNFGSKLTNYAEKLIIQETGIKVFWCNAREESIGFYEKQGWTFASEVFQIQGVGPHRKMVKTYE